MKHFLTIAICLLSSISWFGQSYSQQNPQPIEPRDIDSENEIWYITTRLCHISLWAEVACCCEDEQVICTVPSYTISCIPGGIFECSKEYIDCQPIIDRITEDGENIYQGCYDPEFSCCLVPCA